MTDKILKICSISKNGEEKDRLTAFANLRNSLHGNGIHRTKTLNIIVSGKNFNFTKDKRLGVGWEHIVILLESNIDILKQILLSNTISSITTEIIDDFAFRN